MTTNIVLVVPKQNHRKVKVTLQDKQPDGTWVDNLHPVMAVIGHGNNESTYLTDTRRLVLEEAD